MKGAVWFDDIRVSLAPLEFTRVTALGQKRGDVWAARADCEPVTESMTAFTLDPQMILKTRESIARELAQ